MCNLMQRTALTLTPYDLPVSVRPATILDATAIAKIHNQYVGTGPHTMEGERWTSLCVKKHLDHFTEREGYLVAEDDRDGVLGWGKIRHYSPRAGYAIAGEISTYVSRDARGRGIGDSLMVELLKMSKRMKYQHLVAKIIAGNGPSFRFHLKHGFELVGVQRKIGMVDGQPADVAIFQRLAA